MTKENALLLLRGWRDKRSNALITASFSDCAEYILTKGRVLDVSDKTLTVGDSGSTFTFRISSSQVSFKYAEPREFSNFDSSTMSDEARCASSLVVIFGVLGRMILLEVFDKDNED
ncbi:MAG TPA: hypothetical protein VGB94_06410 [Acidobacteriaceae bacterium]